LPDLWFLPCCSKASPVQRKDILLETRQLFHLFTNIERPILLLIDERSMDTHPVDMKVEDSRLQSKTKLKNPYPYWPYLD
jgi:hypothetical protein